MIVIAALAMIAAAFLLALPLMAAFEAVNMTAAARHLSAGA